ncbi:MAG: phosphatidate cytidylyltransferase [Sandaracinaceae bacterium]
MSETPDPSPTAESPTPEKKGLPNLAVRLLSAAVGIPIILWMLFMAPSWVFSSFGLIAGAIGASELAGMTLKGSRVLQAWLVLATMGAVAVLTFMPEGLPLVGLIFGVVLTGALSVLVQPEPMKQAGWRMGWMIAGPLYIGGAISAIAMLHHLDNGGVWVVLSMMLAWGSDTGGYFAGKAFGKRKLYEKISPKKTIEGSIGGLVTIVGMAIAVRFVWLPELSVLHAVLLALGAGAIGQAGDLCVSVIKRSTGVKDSGKIIPGHGGLLDRIDALMFTAMVTVLYTRFVLGLEGTLPELPF